MLHEWRQSENPADQQGQTGLESVKPPPNDLLEKWPVSKADE
jgi:hypothetical protein